MSPTKSFSRHIDAYSKTHYHLQQNLLSVRWELVWLVSMVWCNWWFYLRLRTMAKRRGTETCLLTRNDGELSSGMLFVPPRGGEIMTILYVCLCWFSSLPLICAFERNPLSQKKGWSWIQPGEPTRGKTGSLCGYRKQQKQANERTECVQSELLEAKS